MDNKNEWANARTLKDYVISLFETQKTNSTEFQTLLKIYGREKLVSIYREFQERVELDKNKIS